MYDLAIVGGGANGAGAARDAALRGLSVALFERDDWGAGTTGHSTRMIHGGLRYLLYDVPTTRASSVDAGRIREIAPHLTFRIPFLWPIYAGEGLFGEAKEALLGVYDRFARAKHGIRHVRLTQAEALQVEPGLAPEVRGALTLDEWGVDVYRLAALNALDAREAGAHLFPHTEVVELLLAGDAPGARTVRGVRARDRLDGRVFDVEARLVLNAAGPWAPFVAAMADAAVPLRPGKGVHVTFERRIGNYGMILEGVDGRTMFLVPHGSETIAGTTDSDFYGDPSQADLDVTADDVAYIVEACARALPQAGSWRILRAWAGVRNTVFEWGVGSDDLSRRHEIVDHERRDGVAGLLSIVGGKLASYREQAEDAIDAAVLRLGRGVAASVTATRALPGAEPEPDFLALSREIPLPPPALAVVWRRLGSRIREVFREAGPDDVAPLCRSEAVTAAEIRYAVSVEGCRTLEDLRRHVHLATGGCNGLDCAIPAAHLMAEFLDWTPEETASHLERFLDRRWIERRPVLRGAALAQEELFRAMLPPPRDRG